jgi:hypothetical protein
MAPTRHKRLDERLEDALEAGLDRGFAAYAAWRADRLPRDIAYLRGRHCQCAPGRPLHLVHSEGLREGADVVIDYGSNVSCPARRQIPVDRLGWIAPLIAAGDVVHVKADRLGQFVEHVFPRITAPFVLVTGDSDFGPVRRFERLLECDTVVRWFVQNCDVDGSHPRLSRIPIGIDNPRYAKLHKRLGFLLAMLAGKTPFDPRLSYNDMGDQDLLLRLAGKTRVRIADKPPLALCTFHMNQKFIPNLEDVPERQEAYRLLRDNPNCRFVARRLRQDEYWRCHDGFAFEICPRGKGLDTFRVWECLVLGTIPIVRRSTLDALFRDEELPVVIVESFEEVTRDNLAAWQAERAGSFTDAMLDKLTNDYWLRRIRDAGQPARIR